MECTLCSAPSMSSLGAPQSSRHPPALCPTSDTPQLCFLPLQPPSPPATGSDSSVGPGAAPTRGPQGLVVEGMAPRGAPAEAAAARRW